MRHTVPLEHRAFAKAQRREPTRAEAMIGQAVRAARRGGGWTFKRQIPFGPYVADFSCAAAHLIVELDGRPHHDPEQQARDAARDRWFQARGFGVLRLPNDRALGSIELAVREIERALPSPAHGEGGEPRIRVRGKLREPGEGARDTPLSRPLLTQGPPSPLKSP